MSDLNTLEQGLFRLTLFSEPVQPDQKTGNW